MNAMAMDQSGAYSSRPILAQDYAVRDRHTAY